MPSTCCPQAQKPCRKALELTSTYRNHREGDCCSLSDHALCWQLANAPVYSCGGFSCAAYGLLSPHLLPCLPCAFCAHVHNKFIACFVVGAPAKQCQPASSFMCVVGVLSNCFALRPARVALAGHDASRPCAGYCCAHCFALHCNCPWASNSKLVQLPWPPCTAAGG